jgi:hypothetical protein
MVELSQWTVKKMFAQEFTALDSNSIAVKRYMEHDLSARQKTGHCGWGTMAVAQSISSVGTSGPNRRNEYPDRPTTFPATTLLSHKSLGRDGTKPFLALLARAVPSDDLEVDTDRIYVSGPLERTELRGRKTELQFGSH